jgi:hypothetical protein
MFVAVSETVRIIGACGLIYCEAARAKHVAVLPQQPNRTVLLYGLGGGTLATSVANELLSTAEKCNARFAGGWMPALA